jgi:SWIM zinc finger
MSKIAFADRLQHNGRSPLQALDLFDKFLSFALNVKQNESCGVLMTADGENDKKCDSRFIDDLLRLAAFLFGSTLDGALTLLENNPKRDILRLISLQSNRTMFIVKGRPCRGSTASDSTYMCMLKEKVSQNSTSNYEHVDSVDEVNDTTEDATTAYCSCRSFSERCQKSREGKALCKHLLAIKLMPFLRIECSVIEVGSDDEYCRIILQRIPFD